MLTIIMKTKQNYNMPKKITLNEAIASYPNDYDLGGFIRRNVENFTPDNVPGYLRLTVAMYPNDTDLGSYIRSL